MKFKKMEFVSIYKGQIISESLGTSYNPKFQKRAITNLKNYSMKNDENLRKPKKGLWQPS